MCSNAPECNWTPNSEYQAASEVAHDSSVVDWTAVFTCVYSSYPWLQNKNLAVVGNTTNITAYPHKPVLVVTTARFIGSA